MRDVEGGGAKIVVAPKKGPERELRPNAGRSEEDGAVGELD